MPSLLHILTPSLHTLIDVIGESYTLFDSLEGENLTFMVDISLRLPSHPELEIMVGHNLHIPIDIISESDAFLGSLESDNVHGGQFQTLHLLDCLCQQCFTARPRNIHTA